jgi:hypothetical protein
MHDTTAAAEPPKKFHIFHERHVWKSSSVNKRASPAENSMIAASHSEQEASVMRKAVGESVDGWRGWQTDPKETASDFRTAHYARNLIQRFQRDFSVCMQKPENIPACCFGSDVHLFGTTARSAPDKLIAEALRKLAGAVGAPAVDENNLRPSRSLAQIRQKRAYQSRLIKNRNDNGNLHCRFWLNFSLRVNASKDVSQNKMVARYVSWTNRIQQI